ncbi:MAG: threonine/serine dehydratase [Dongiaceae bacterium]
MTREMPLPDLGSIEAAAARLAGAAVETPLLESSDLNTRTGGRVFIKPEMLQRTGSFKFRGAFNKISQIPTGHKGGVVAFSSGNHAQGVAAAAQARGLPAVIVMPADAPAIKIANTRGYGAEVILYDRYREDRERVAGRLVEERGAVLVRPYDDTDVIAGQGTIGREIARQAQAKGIRPEIVLAPCGGGGMIGGCAVALTTLVPDVKVYAVEPAGFDDTVRSLAAHRRLGNAPGATTICDALMAATPGQLTFAINDRLLAGGFAVSDDEVRAAMGYAFRVLKLVIEPGGAVALAAVLAGKLDLRDRTAAIVCSGGNVDPAAFCAAISES